MKRFLAIAALLALAMPATPQTTSVAPALSEGLFVYPNYDKTRDPDADLKTAITAAKASNHRVLIEVGGDWCVWCHILDRFIASSPEVSDAFRKSFLVVKVNYSQDQPNAAFLGKYPKIPGYPHFFVLETDGAFLKSQGTSPLEKGESYNKQKVLAFARSWLRN